MVFFRSFFICRAVFSASPRRGPFLKNLLLRLRFRHTKVVPNTPWSQFGKARMKKPREQGGVFSIFQAVLLLLLSPSGALVAP